MTAHHHIAIIGSGFSGLGMALALRRRGHSDFVVFERAGEVGGTWRDNTYPGCACDVKSDLYSFSFAPNPNWSHRYARQPEILEYLRRSADALGVRPHIRFGHELLRAEWDDAASLWRLDTSGGAYTAQHLVSGHGPLIEPRWPELAGLEAFSGPRFHSAQWDHTVKLEGRRVAVIGTGASAIQFVPQIQPLAAQVTVFQRSAPWIMPRLDAPTSPVRRSLFRRCPPLQRLVRQWIFALSEVQHLSFSDPRINRVAEHLARAHLEAQISDPALRRKLTPSYRPGCKRILVSDDYYPALRQPNVELVTEALREVRGNTLITADGAQRRFDVLIGATGFNATRPPIARRIFGQGGRALSDAWDTHMEALHGTTVTGFPNLFLIVGPNTALGHTSIVYIIEAQVHYILQALEFMEREHLQAVWPRAEAQQRYNAALQAKLRTSVWVQGGCSSYYLDAHGRNSTLWPERASRFRATLRRFDPELYHLRLSPQRLPARFAGPGRA